MSFKKDSGKMPNLHDMSMDPDMSINMEKIKELKK